MKKTDNKNHGFQESVQQQRLTLSVLKLKKGKMSKAFEAGLDAVENMGKKNQH